MPYLLDIAKDAFQISLPRDLLVIQRYMPKDRNYENVILLTENQEIKYADRKYLKSDFP